MAERSPQGLGVCRYSRESCMWECVDESWRAEHLLADVHTSRTLPCQVEVRLKRWKALEVPGSSFWVDLRGRSSVG